MSNTIVVAPRTCWWQVAAPAALVSAGYVDPGNWGTDVAAGAMSGHRLLWVLAVAVLAALFLQQLAARLGLAAGRDLAQLIQTRLPRPMQAVVRPGVLVALAVTEVVEVFGVVIAVQLLTGWSLPRSVTVAAGLVLLVVLAPAGIGRRCVFGCLGVIGLVYLLVLTRQLGSGLLPGLAPRPLTGAELPIAIGLVGSVVMPHNVLLHSRLARELSTGPGSVRGLLRRSLYTTGAALLIAFAVNAAITLLAAQVSRRSDAGLSATFGDLHAAYGQAAAVMFAFTLLAAGLASSVTGGMASSDVLLQFHPDLKLSAQLRRMCCLVPAIGLAASGLPIMPVLVWSQVLLALALPLVLVPLLYFVSRRDVMGVHVIGWPSRVLGGLITTGLIGAGFLALS